MASTTSISVSYVGRSLTQYISAALFENETFSQNLIFPLTAVKYKIAVPKLDFSNGLIQADAPTWDPTGTLTRGENVLTPVKMKINFQDNINSWENSWEGDRMIAGAMNSSYTADLAGYINSQLIKTVGQQIEIAVWASNWSGASATSLTASTISGFNGMLKRIDDNSPVRVVGTTLSAANILTELAKVYNAIPNQVKTRSVIGMSKTALGYYKQALAAQVSIGNLENAQGTTYLGIQLYGLAGYPDNVMASFVPGYDPYHNLFMATDLTSDMAMIKIIDMRDTNGTDYFFYKMRMMLDTGVGYGAECVLYK